MFHSVSMAYNSPCTVLRDDQAVHWRGWGWPDEGDVIRCELLGVAFLSELCEKFPIKGCGHSLS